MIKSLSSKNKTVYFTITSMSVTSILPGLNSRKPQIKEKTFHSWDALTTTFTFSFYVILFRVRLAHLTAAFVCYIIPSDSKVTDTLASRLESLCKCWNLFYILYIILNYRLSAQSFLPYGASSGIVPPTRPKGFAL